MTSAEQKKTHKYTWTLLINVRAFPFPVDQV